MHLKCEICGYEFSRIEGATEAELALRRGEFGGDFVCPNCGSGDNAITEVWA